MGLACDQHPMLGVPSVKVAREKRDALPYVYRTNRKCPHCGIEPRTTYHVMAECPATKVQFDQGAKEEETYRVLCAPRQLLERLLHAGDLRHPQGLSFFIKPPAPPD
eukprot:TRINITY_DN1743_c0_g1_i1.p2 TRINITY_DN1743_c0_g1~~TRINITY_DN1743_c0_g1_i1.p2  ORF type:complete len:107 (+),score=3.88 TRINITY_DN1743_c0_g1_i1:122-442(+)